MELYHFLLSLIIGFLTILYINFFWRRRKMYEFLDKLPGPRRFWIPGLEGINHAMKFIGKENQEIFEILREYSNEFQSPNKVWLFNKCVVMVDDPKDIQVVLTSPNSLEKSDVQKKLPTPLGIVSADVDRWKAHRKYLNPAFRTSVLRSLHPISNAKAKRLMIHLSKRLESGEFNILKPLVACTLEAFMETMMGMKRDFISNEDHRYLQLCAMSQKYLGQKLVKVWLHSPAILRLTKYYKLEQDLIYGDKGVLKMADEIMLENQSRKLLLLGDSNNADDDDNDENENRNVNRQQVLIDYLMANKLNWPMDELKDEINTFLVAGFETSALTLAGAILMLAMHKEVQAKVVGELREVFQTVDQEVTEEHLKQLVYLEQVLNETLRLFPVLPMLTRHSTGEVKLENFTIPADVEILLPIFNTQRNTKYWGSDAHLFIPERFEPERLAKVHPYAFTPFSQGPRICIGMKYSMNVMKIILSQFLRNFQVNTNLKYEDIQFELQLTIKVKQDYMVTIAKREF